MSENPFKNKMVAVMNKSIGPGKVVAINTTSQRVQEALRAKGLDFKVMELSSSTRTAQDAATTLSCTISQIVKSLLFKTKISHQSVLILASGSNRVNEQAIAKHLEEGIEKSDANFAREMTGFAIGGIPPIGHKTDIKHIFIDEDLLKYDTLWAAAGTPNSVFKLHSKDLTNLTNGIIINIVNTGFYTGI